jgi:long-chain acyl-CoA synthetase
MSDHWLADRIATHGDELALTGFGGNVTYNQLKSEIAELTEQLASAGVGPGSVVLFTADFSLTSCAAIFAIASVGGVIVPFSPYEERTNELKAIVGATHEITPDGSVEKIRRSGELHPLVERLAKDQKPGLVIFTSGSTGEPKAALHDFDTFTEKYRKPTRRLVTIAVSPMDHIAGLDTLFYSLANSGLIVTVSSPTPQEVLASIENNDVQILPATPSFLRLLLISGELNEVDLSSLELVAYGAEVMPNEVLERLVDELPGVKFIQKFGMTEIGSPATRSPESGSDWIKMDPESTEIKIIDDIVWIRSDSLMLGYLNAESPIDSDGWFNTGDTVEQSGEYIRVLGRSSEMINVGGHKVNPHEIENIILKAQDVTAVVVRAEKNPLLGQIPVAYVESVGDESDQDLAVRIRLWCSERLNRWEVPAKVVGKAPDLIPGRLKLDRSDN